MNRDVWLYGKDVASFVGVLPRSISVLLLPTIVSRRNCRRLLLQFFFSVVDSLGGDPLSTPSPPPRFQLYVLEYRMNKATLNRALRKRALPSGPFVVTQPSSIKQTPIPSQKPVAKSIEVKKDFERDLQGAKLAGDTGDHNLALTSYLALLHVS